jgi:hypothetical protein
LNIITPKKITNTTFKIGINLSNFILFIHKYIDKKSQSRLQKLDGLKYENLKENIQKVISEIPKEKYENIFKGAYKRPEKYVPKNKTRKVKKSKEKLQIIFI